WYKNQTNNRHPIPYIRNRMPIIGLIFIPQQDAVGCIGIILIPNIIHKYFLHKEAFPPRY
ncbi:hypothetical protein, partial [Listeria booriae]|uniref:hypothetical protein n=1 Tax=Listeria booriae TaxID=1552123 RepID=UPI001C8BCFC4